MCAVMCAAVLFASCSGDLGGVNPNGAPAVPAPVQSAAESAADVSPVGSGTDSSIVLSLVDYANKNWLPEWNAQMGDTFKITFSARGEAFVVTYQYIIPLPTGMTNDEFTAEADANKDSYLQLVSQLKGQGAAGASVVIEFKAQDGTILFTKEYKG